MSTIDEIMGQADDYARAWADAQSAEMGCRGTAYAYRAEEKATLRDLIAAALADARREGAEAMQAGAFDACVAQADADRRFAKSERNAGAVDCATELAEIIRSLPMPTGERQAVLLTDDAADAHAKAVVDAAEVARRNYRIGSADSGTRSAVRAIEAEVLAANNMGVSRG